MKTLALLAAAAVLLPCGASAQSIVGPGALALAAMVAGPLATVAPSDKQILTRLLNGETNFDYAPGKTIAVGASAVTCRASNVAIEDHSCVLAASPDSQVTITGRGAHELYATLAEIGVPSDGAAGSSYEAVTNLACTVDPAEVRENAGGGASCTFDTAN